MIARISDLPPANLLIFLGVGATLVMTSLTIKMSYRRDIENSTARWRALCAGIYSFGKHMGNMAFGYLVAIILLMLSSLDKALITTNWRNALFNLSYIFAFSTTVLILIFAALFVFYDAFREVEMSARL